jgi:hypothetical protein
MALGLALAAVAGVAATTSVAAARTAAASEVRDRIMGISRAMKSGRSYHHDVCEDLGGISVAAGNG